ncbi:MAG: SDR family oxidoreductase, partial [Pyrinomonadaceae bacterium]
MSFTVSIFLTGFPGFIATRLVQKLAKADVQFFLLVQEQFVERAMIDVQRIADRTGTPVENFALIVGDITLENLGIEAEDLETLRAEV